MARLGRGPADPWRPSRDELARYGHPIPDDEYETKDFEKVVALRARTEAIARHLTEFPKKSDRFAKTIVFCVDQEQRLRFGERHGRAARRALYTGAGKAGASRGGGSGQEGPRFSDRRTASAYRERGRDVPPESAACIAWRFDEGRFDPLAQ